VCKEHNLYAVRAILGLAHQKGLEPASSAATLGYGCVRVGRLSRRSRFHEKALPVVPPGVVIREGKSLGKRCGVVADRLRTVASTSGRITRRSPASIPGGITPSCDGGPIVLEAGRARHCLWLVKAAYCAVCAARCSRTVPTSRCGTVFGYAVLPVRALGPAMKTIRRLRPSISIGSETWRLCG
jgi:hypothetical protein